MSFSLFLGLGIAYYAAKTWHQWPLVKLQHQMSQRAAQQNPHFSEYVRDDEQVAGYIFRVTEGELPPALSHNLNWVDKLQVQGPYQEMEHDYFNPFSLDVARPTRHIVPHLHNIV